MLNDGITGFLSEVHFSIQFYVINCKIGYDGDQNLRLSQLLRTLPAGLDVRK